MTAVGALCSPFVRTSTSRADPIDRVDDAGEAGRDARLLRLLASDNDRPENAFVAADGDEICVHREADAVPFVAAGTADHDLSRLVTASSLSS